MGKTVTAAFQKQNIPFNVIGKHKPFDFVTRNEEFLVHPEENLGHIDKLLVCTKAFSVSQVLREHKAECYVLVNNGLLKLRDELSLPNNVFGVVNSNGSLLTGDTVWHTPGKFLIGKLRNANENDVRDLCKLRMLGASYCEKGFEEALWLKLCVNTVICSLTSIHRCRNGDLFKYENEIKEIAHELYQATNLDSTRIIEAVQSVYDSTYSNKSSMLVDIEHRRRTEIDYFTGYVLKVGREKNLALKKMTEIHEKIRQILEDE